MSTSTAVCLAVPVALMLFSFLAIRMGVTNLRRVNALIASYGPVQTKLLNRAALYVTSPPEFGFWETQPDGSTAFHVQTLTATTTVDVETAGGIAAVRGRNLATKAGAGLLTFGVGALLVGNAHTDVIDKRELYLIVESDKWATVIPCHADHGQLAREFAVALRLAIRGLSTNDQTGERA